MDGRPGVVMCSEALTILGGDPVGAGAAVGAGTAASCVPEFTSPRSVWLF